MLTQILVVSDPPHGNVDAAALGGLLGLPTEDARLKLSYPAPEVLSSSDAARADEVARDMEEAGMSVVIVDAAKHAERQRGQETLVVRTGNNDVAIHYDEPVVGVYCAPPADSTANPSPPRHSAAASPEVEAGLKAAESLEWMPHLDLYYQRDGRARRSPSRVICPTSQDSTICGSPRRPRA